MYSPREHSWELQQLHHLGSDVARLQEAVDTLKGAVSEQSRSIEGVKRTIHVATGFVACGALIGGVLLAMIAWIVDKGFDRLIEALPTN